MAKKSYNALADGVITLVCVGFALWLALTVMQFISSMEQKNPSILVKTILNKAFVVLIVVMILRLDSVEFFRLALEPLFNTGFKLAQLVMEGADGSKCSGGYNILLPQDGGGLPSSMGVSIVCTIETIQDKLLDIMALGSKPEGFVSNLGLELNKWGNILINENYQTSNPKIFSGGDLAGIKGTVAWAAQSGREAANKMVEFLEVE